MPIPMHHRAKTTGLAALALVLGATSLFFAEPGICAETNAVPAAAGRLALMRAVEVACATDYPRFCPQDTIVAPDHHSNGRDMAICLKFVKTSLSLGCRHAVSAAMP